MRLSSGGQRKVVLQDVRIGNLCDESKTMAAFHAKREDRPTPLAKTVNRLAERLRTGGTED